MKSKSLSTQQKVLLLEVQMEQSISSKNQKMRKKAIFIPFKEKDHFNI